jgi:hypothetical protein
VVQQTFNTLSRFYRRAPGSIRRLFSLQKGKIKTLKRVIQESILSYRQVDKTKCSPQLKLSLAGLGLLSASAAASSPSGTGLERHTINFLSPSNRKQEHNLVYDHTFKCGLMQSFSTLSRASRFLHVFLQQKGSTT